MASVLTRRALLRGLGGLAAGVTASVLIREGLDEKAPSSGGDAVPATSAPTPEEALAVVGAAYLAAHPASLDALRAAVPPVAGAGDRGALRAALPAIQAMVRRDFASGDTVLVDGWVLAETEARAAAIASLLPT